MNETVDYDKVLAELMEERENLDNMIAWVQKRLGRNDVGASLPNSAGESSEPRRFPRLLPSHAFFRMKVPQAIRAYLNFVKRPRSAKEITQGLKDGGFASRAKNLYATVFPSLLRMEKTEEIERVGKGEWGLSEWYKGRKGDVDEKERQPNEE